MAGMQAGCNRWSICRLASPAGADFGSPDINRCKLSLLPPHPHRFPMSHTPKVGFVSLGCPRAAQSKPGDYTAHRAESESTIHAAVADVDGARKMLATPQARNFSIEIIR